MKLPRWQTLRIYLLALIFTGVLGVILRAILAPNSEEKLLANSFVFPATVPLSGWQLTKATALKADNQFKTNPGQRYQYRQNDHHLDVLTRYEIYTDGNVSRLLSVYTSIPPATVNLSLKQREGIGFYGTFSDQEKAYLSACVNPKGESTITEQQFVHNKYTYGWSIKRILLWVVGQNDLLDGRCLWTLMSSPVAADGDSTRLDAAYRQLETAWFDWYRWWQSKLEMRDEG